MKKTSPKVSVIIPVYNTVDYLKEAIESILNQTLNDIEIIIINDGSTDGSLSVLECFAQRDMRVKIFSQENQGLSMTRNKGIDYSSGKYIYFMDSDDYLQKEALESCYLKCENNSLDFLFFDADILNRDSDLCINLNYTRNGSTDENIIYNGLEVMNILVSNWAFTSSAWLNFINLSFLKRVNLRFYPGIIHEDQLFTSLLFLKSKRVMYINKSFFLRRFRADSIMTRRFSWKNVIGYFTVSRELIKYKETNNKETNDCIDRFLSQMLNAAIRSSYILEFKERCRVLLICLIEFHKYINFRSYAIVLFKKYIQTKSSNQP